MNRSVPVTKDSIIATGVGIHSSGTYSGDESTNRAIPHGLGVIPTLVIISSVGWVAGGYAMPFRITPDGAISDGTDHYTVTSMDDTNFYVGSSDDASDRVKSANYSQTYYWVAFI